MCDMDRKNILKKHRHSELESILTLTANKLVDPDLFKDLERKKNDRYFWATADLKAVVEERMKEQEMNKMNEE